MPGTVLLDLDGTLSDSRDGILRSLHHALETVGAPSAPDEALERFIGPPLQHSLAALLGQERVHDVPRALAAYRERYTSIGLYEAHAYPGVSDMLSALAAEGHRLLVCTSKPTVYAVRVLRHLELDRSFEAIFGSELDGTRSDKRELLAYALSRTAIPPATALMVGDREHDAIAALGNGVRAVGAGWGYGSLDELRQAGVHVIAEAPEDLPPAVRDLLEGR